MSHARTLSTWESLAELELVIEDYALEPLTASVSSNFERKTTVIRLRGGALAGTGGTLAGTGEEGIGDGVGLTGRDHRFGLSLLGQLLLLESPLDVPAHALRERRRRGPAELTLGPLGAHHLAGAAPDTGSLAWCR